MPITVLTTELDRRVEALYRENQALENSFTDRLFAALMVIQFLGCILIALIISPRTWIGSESTVHIHVWAAIGLGGILSSLPIFLAVFHPGKQITRQVIAVAQALYSALLIHLMGGRIEAHFHVFGSLAFLAFYKDVKVLITATAVTAVDHCVRGLFWPESVFGIMNASNWRWVEHAGWVIFEDIFLIISITRARQQAHALAETTAKIESQKHLVEQQVRERTQDLEIALDNARAADQAKSDFLANMSHEIRTPMTAILGYADLLQNEQESDEQSLDRTVRSINDNAQHLLKLINDILDVSKIKAGQMSIDRIEVDPMQVIDDTVELLAQRGKEKGIRVSAIYSTMMPRQIQTDPIRLRQIMLNLLGNALKFTDSGMITAHVSCDPANESLLISVADTGIGMSPEQVEAISQFKAFNQADASMSRRFGGSGLGLKISDALARELGKGIQISSDEGLGSRFSFTIDTGRLEGVPMIMPGNGPVTRETSESKDPEQMTEPAKKLSGIKVLLAEDGPDNQRLITFHLKKAGAQVLVCKNGLIAAQTIEAAKEQDLPQVVFMDMQMPELDGYSATRRLRDKGLGLPIIALTAHAMEGDRQKCLDAGCDDYLTKPIDKNLLIETCLRYALAGSPQQALA